MKNITLALTCLLLTVASNGQRYLTPQFTNVDVATNIKYGENLGYNTSFLNTEDLVMDVYTPAGDTVSNRPVIILGHGGSFLSLYTWGVKEQYSIVELCKRYARLGYVAVSINYRLGWAAGDNDAETREKTIINAVYRAMQDFKTCIRYFRKDAVNGNTYRINPCKIFVGGTNSGGYAALACSMLNQQSELTGIKFLDGSGNPYINQSLTGDFDGFGGSQNINNYPGFSSRPSAILALGTATGDTTWVQAGEVPVVAFHGVEEVTTPYNTARVITSSGTPIIVVSGSGDFMPYVDALGNNNIFKGKGFAPGPPNKQNGVVLQPVEGLYPFYGQGFEPWSWYDGAQPIGDPNLNPGASQTKAMKFIDTIMQYSTVRFFEIIKDTASCQFTTGVNEQQQLAAKIYPNPVNQTLHISFEDAAKPTTITLTSLTGSVLITKEQVTKEEYLEVGGLPCGSYLLTISDGTSVNRKKVVIIH